MFPEQGPRFIHLYFNSNDEVDLCCCILGITKGVQLCANASCRSNGFLSFDLSSQVIVTEIRKG